MSRKLKPETRQAVIVFAAAENVDYTTGLEILIHKGFQAVHEPVENHREKSGAKL